MRSKQAVEVVNALIAEQADEYSTLRGMFSDEEVGAMQRLVLLPNIGIADRDALKGLLVRNGSEQDVMGGTLNRQRVTAIRTLLKSTRRLRTLSPSYDARLKEREL